MGRRHLYLIRRSPRRYIQIFAYLNQAFAEFTEFAHQPIDTFMVLRLNMRFPSVQLSNSDDANPRTFGSH
jgi:hypothetical protein